MHLVKFMNDSTIVLKIHFHRKHSDCGKIFIKSDANGLSLTNDMQELWYLPLIQHVTVYADHKCQVVEPYAEEFRLLKEKCGEKISSLELYTTNVVRDCNLEIIQEETKFLKTLIMVRCSINYIQLSKMQNLERLWLHRLPVDFTSISALSSLHTFCLTDTYQMVSGTNFFQMTPKLKNIFSNSPAFIKSILSVRKTLHKCWIKFGNTAAFTEFLNTHALTSRNIDSIHLILNLIPTVGTPEIQSLHLYLYEIQLSVFVQQIVYLPRLQKLCICLKSGRIAMSVMDTIVRCFPNLLELSFQNPGGINNESEF